jgi:hypothetical protein
MRLSSNQTDASGEVVNGYDYGLQAWVTDGIIETCGHPETMRRNGPCCNANRFQGLPLAEAKRRLDVDSSKGNR